MGWFLNLNDFGFEVLGIELGCKGEILVDDYS